MDNLTHSLAGALLGQAGLKRSTGLAMPALVIGANLPDIDATCALIGTESLALRRGLTHGPIAWVLLPLALAGLLWWFDRWQERRGTRPDTRSAVRFGRLYVLALLACLTHPALDWLNSYGIRLLEPFSSRWFYGDALFIVDPWLLAILGAGLWLSLRRERAGGDHWRRPAAISLAAMLAYIGANLITTRDFARTETLDANAGPTLAAPVWLRFWQRDLIFPHPGGRYTIIPAYAGPGTGSMTTRRLGGEVDLASCRLDQLARTRGDVRAFLFWSRLPFVERTAGGGLYLRDARFAGNRLASRFAVPLPPSACGSMRG